SYPGGYYSGPSQTVTVFVEAYDSVEEDKIEDIQVIPYETIVNENINLPEGEERIVQEGVNGSKTITTTTRTHYGEMIGEPLVEESIKEPISEIIEIGTGKVEVDVQTHMQEILFETEYVNNPDLMVGTEEVSQDGVNGVRTIVEEVTTVGNVETNREVISEEVTTAPINKVIQVGIKAITKETRTEEIAFEIEYVNNPDLLVETVKVSQEGVKGIRTIIEEVTTIGGEEINREVISDEVTSAPINKVVQVGTKAAVIEDIATYVDGWKVEDNKWVYYKGSEKLSGWQQITNHWYYMNSSGYMQTGWTKVGNTWYYMSSSGAMQTGWTKDGNTWYYLSGSGAMQTGWTKVGNTWYYMNSSGAMQTGWTKVGNTWYYMNSSGAMQTGWTKVGNTWYYLSGSGAMQTGWLKLGQTWYFLNNDGSMQVQNKTINGKWYRFDSSGRML
ncbi:G5 domain-containing protein, partial [Jeotgalibaca porci]|uniref:G5 domain-containing protein n=1 Tax=Jeotgalibaca porci TaxID=1868793 RepID=UPI0035A1CB32